MPNVKVRGEAKVVQVLKTERRQLESAMEALAGLEACGDKNAAEIRGRLTMLLKDITREDYGTFATERKESP